MSFRPSANVQALAEAIRPALGLGASGTPPPPDLRFIAERHRVTLLLHHALGLRGHREDEELLSQIARLAQLNARGTLLQKAAGARLERLLDERGIDSIEIKGWRLGHLLYGENTLRQSRDVDVLLRPEQIFEAVEAVVEAGFKNMRGEPLKPSVARAMLRFHREVEVRDPRSRVTIELHSRSLENPPAGWSDTTMLADPLDLSNPEYVLYLILHGAGSNWNRLKWLADLAMIAQRVESDVMLQVVDLARALDCLPAVSASFRACGAIWGEGLVGEWLAAAALRVDDERTQLHLQAFARALNREDSPSKMELTARRLELVRDSPICGERPLPHLSSIGKRTAMWLLRRV